MAVAEDGLRLGEACGEPKPYVVRRRAHSTERGRVWEPEEASGQTATCRCSGATSMTMSALSWAACVRARDGRRASLAMLVRACASSILVVLALLLALLALLVLLLLLLPPCTLAVDAFRLFNKMHPIQRPPFGSCYFWLNYFSFF